jgi:hypothetical protein
MTDDSDIQGLTLEEKLAKAKAEHIAWSTLAARPNLSPEAARAAKNLARSYRAAWELYRKAADWQNVPRRGEQAPNLFHAMTKARD